MKPLIEDILIILGIAVGGFVALRLAVWLGERWAKRKGY
jgi:energy-converting hydrogenase Eha subunit B